MNTDDFDKPVPIEKTFRFITGVVFLIFATVFGDMATSSLLEKLGGSPKSYANFSFLLVMAVLAIGVGYAGVRLIVVSDNERVLGRIVRCRLLLHGRAAALLLTSGDLGTLLSSAPEITTLVVMGGGGYFVPQHGNTISTNLLRALPRMLKGRSAKDP